MQKEHGLDVTIQNPTQEKPWYQYMNQNKLRIKSKVVSWTSWQTQLVTIDGKQ